MKLWIGSLLVFLLFFLSCQEKKLSGEQLAKAYCISCHQFPEPDLLDKNTWQKYILPRMGFMMGVLPIDSVGVDFIEPEMQEEIYQNPRVMRSESVLTQEEWQAIHDFYIQNAPSHLTSKSLDLDTTDFPFQAHFPDFFLSPPSTTLLKYTEDGLLLGDANSKKLYFLNQNLEVQQAANTKEGAVAANEVDEGYLITSMGSFSPTDRASGLVFLLPKQAGKASIRLLTGLKRPVHTEVADLDQDEVLDFIVCEYGKWTGGLSWWKNSGNGTFERHVLRNMPGAIKAYPHDWNQDGLMDIIALFGQGDEGIFIYYNEGSGQFREEQILAFPPSYGSSYFQLFDYNGDEYLDLIYTAGDAADFPPIAKSYQGIRIFQNDGNNQFEEAFFFPLQGAYAAIPGDFDQDGDLDIAAISFFPDFTQNTRNSFVYLENQGDMQMKAYTFLTADKGRWIVMDSGDLDKDGDIDLVLGSLAFEVIPKMGLVEQWVQDGIPFVYLENKKE
ncbi:MAG: VCBS repeat-containing protein [Bacteroidota bacterium]